MAWWIIHIIHGFGSAAFSALFGFPTMGAIYEMLGYVKRERSGYDGEDYGEDVEGEGEDVDGTEDNTGDNNGGENWDSWKVAF